MKRLFFIFECIVFGIILIMGCGDNSTDSKDDISDITTLGEGLVGYWNFDTCLATDSSGNGQDGTVYGNPKCIDGIKGKAIEFDGIDDYIIIPDSDVLDTDYCMTIAFWIKPYSINSGGSKFISKWYSAPEEGDWLFTLSSQEACNGNCVAWSIWVANYNDFKNYASVGPSNENQYLPLNNWNHIAATYDSGYVKLYYNGTFINEKHSDIKYTSLNEYSTDDIYIGQNHNHREFYKYNGALDEIRIYNRPLSEEEILYLAH